MVDYLNLKPNEAQVKADCDAHWSAQIDELESEIASCIDLLNATRRELNPLAEDKNDLEEAAQSLSELARGRIDPARAGARQIENMHRVAGGTERVKLGELILAEMKRTKNPYTIATLHRLHKAVMDGIKTEPVKTGGA